MSARRPNAPPPLPPDLFNALVQRLADLVLKDLEVAENDELELSKDEHQTAHHQSSTRRRPCA